MPDRHTPHIVLLMAALIASVKTARFDAKEFQGMKSPRLESAMANSLTHGERLLRIKPFGKVQASALTTSNAALGSIKYDWHRPNGLEERNTTVYTKTLRLTNADPEGVRGHTNTGHSNLRGRMASLLRGVPRNVAPEYSM